MAAALSDWLIGEMAGFLARGSSGGSRLKTHDTQALRDNAAPVGSQTSMAGFLARGSSGGSRLKTHDEQALKPAN